MAEMSEKDRQKIEGGPECVSVACIDVNALSREKCRENLVYDKRGQNDSTLREI